jgi:hypothetical protein
MPVTISTLEGEPILIATYGEPFNPGNDVRQAVRSFVQTAREGGQPLYTIHDTRDLRLTFGSVLISISAATQGEDNLLTPDVQITTYVVGTGPAIDFAVQMSEKITHGALRVRPFATLDAAIHAARTGR